MYTMEPYKGQYIDGPDYGHPPLPWEIACGPDKMFHDHTKYLEVPHTAVLKVTADH